jgi:hypothetical protein
MQNESAGVNPPHFQFDAVPGLSGEARKAVNAALTRSRPGASKLPTTTRRTASKSSRS